MIQVTDYISLVSPVISKRHRTQYVDSIIKSMDEQVAKGAGAETVVGLETRVRATHAGRLTGHYHYYAPAKVRKAVDSLTKPYPKPVLTNHDTDKDPIGRFVRATYVATPNSIIPQAILMKLDADSKHNENTHKDVRKIGRHLASSDWEGLGYVDAVVNITDPDAIIKVMDKRYLTVSVGYSTDTVHCSECGYSWVGKDKCEHSKGGVYSKDGTPMFLIFGNLDYSEMSFVNTPADDIAAAYETRRIQIPVLQDSFKKTRSVDKRRVISEEILDIAVNSIDAVNRIPATKVGLYVYDFKNNDYIPLDNKGDNVKTLSEIVKMGIDSYELLKPYLSVDSVLSAEKLAELREQDFVGINNSFPAVDAAHIEASRQLLSTLEDSQEKEELLGFLDARLTMLAVASETTDTAETTTEETTETTDSTEDTSTTISFVIGKDNVVTVPEDLSVETKDALIKTLKGSDYVTYEFKLEGGGWGIPDPESPNHENEKGILALLLKMYSQKKEDASDSLRKIVSENEDSKQAFIELASELGIVGDSQKLNNLQKEYKIMQDALKSYATKVDSLTNELKATYISELQALADKHSASPSTINLTDKYEGSSLAEIKAAVDAVRMTIGHVDKVEAPEVKDPTLHFVNKDQKDSDNINKLTQAQLERKKSIDKQYLVLKRTNGDAIATNWYNTAMRQAGLAI